MPEASAMTSSCLRADRAHRRRAGQRQRADRGADAGRDEPRPIGTMPPAAKGQRERGMSGRAELLRVLLDRPLIYGSARSGVWTDPDGRARRRLVEAMFAWCPADRFSRGAVRISRAVDEEPIESSTGPHRDYSRPHHRPPQG